MNLEVKSDKNRQNDVYVLFRLLFNPPIIKLSKNIRRIQDMNTDKIYAEALANEYTPKDNSKVVALKKLDKRAKLPATIFTYTFGILAALVFGVGMCLSMKVIGNGIGMFVLGVFAGIIGMICMGINYPIYKVLMENGKKKYAFEIVELAKEIAEND